MVVSRAGYAALPNPNQEMDDAFASDGEDNDVDVDAPGENSPMISNADRDASRSRSPSPPLPPQQHQRQQSQYRFQSTLQHPLQSAPAYDFEYDYPPPPGSPPRPSALALPNNIGNSNGLVPEEPVAITAPTQRQGWFRRTVGAILPTHYQRPTGAGTDGVWANVMANPTTQNTDRVGIERVQVGDGVYVVPEETQKDAPPSYATAQADAVPPYWETTIHAPSVGQSGELLVEGIPAGSLFSFLCNLLISMSFQFIGFMLTSILASTHAAKYGSRAGLGVTLIQYGFYLRTRDEIQATGSSSPTRNPEYSRLWPWQRPKHTQPGMPTPTFGSAIEADRWHAANNGTATPTNPTHPFRHSAMGGDLSTLNEWLSFFLMTLGWFVLLTSVLSFWRTKRWERGIQQSSPSDGVVESSGSGGLSFGVFPGLGYGPSVVVQEDRERDEVVRTNLARAFGIPELENMPPPPPMDPERARRLEQARRVDERLQADLRAAGLL